MSALRPSRMRWPSWGHRLSEPQWHRPSWIVYEPFYRRFFLRLTFPDPLRDAATFARNVANLLRRGAHQVDGFNKVGFAAAVGPDQEVERLEFDTRIVRAEGQEVPGRQVLDQDGVGWFMHDGCDFPIIVQWVREVGMF